MAAEVEFHTGVADKVAFACRLLRKAYRKGARVVVTGPREVLAALDRELWTFDERDFVPHARVNAPGALAEALARAGDAALDPCWRMPVDSEYDEALKSNFADVANVGNRAGGAITAAKFLHRFARKYRWAHLDIAGTAWKSGAAKGATGRPVPLLTHFVLAQAK